MDALTLAERPTIHPDDAVLIDYQAGRLPAAEAETLATHLASCPECSRFVLAARAFSAEPDELPQVDADDLAADWQKLRRRLVVEGEASRSPFGSADSPSDGALTESSAGSPPSTARMVPVGVPKSGWGWLSSPAVGYGLAATLLFVIVGLQWTHGRDAARLAELESWKAATGELTSDFALLSVGPWGATRDSPDIPLVCGGDVLLLGLPNVAMGDALVLEVADGDGVVHHRLGGLRGLETGAIQLKLPPSSLAPGLHTLSLRTDGGEVMATYKIKVAASGC